MRKKILVEFTLPENWVSFSRTIFRDIVGDVGEENESELVEFLESAKFVTPCDSTENARDTIP